MNKVRMYVADIGDYAPGGEMCWCGVNFPRDLTVITYTRNCF